MFCFIHEIVVAEMAADRLPLPPKIEKAREAIDYLSSLWLPGLQVAAELVSTHSGTKPPR